MGRDTLLPINLFNYKNFVQIVLIFKTLPWFITLVTKEAHSSKTKQEASIIDCKLLFDAVYVFSLLDLCECCFL